jgi:hypothetical protein
MAALWFPVLRHDVLSATICAISADSIGQHGRLSTLSTRQRGEALDRLDPLIGSPADRRTDLPRGCR